MELKDILCIEVDITVEPHSVFSKVYKEKRTLDFSGNIGFSVRCPNGTCTKKFISVTDEEMRSEAVKALSGGETSFVISAFCAGWEDWERSGAYHCDSHLTAVVRLLSLQKTDAGA